MGFTNQDAGEFSRIQQQEVKVGDAKQEGSPNGERQGDIEHQMQCEGTADEVHKETEEDGKEDGEDDEGSESDSFINDDEGYDDSDASEDVEGAITETPLTDAEVEELISELLVAESEAAEAQESLEEDSVKVVEKEVRDELAQTLQGDELEAAVASEMDAFSEQWKMKLSDLETEIAFLLEQLDGAGIELPSVYKWIERQAPKVCSTEAWIKRVHWAGSAVPSELSESVSKAEEFLQSCRPVKSQRGKLLEVGASGFLSRKLAIHDNSAGAADDSRKDWSLFNQIIGCKAGENASFRGKNWASVYLANTPKEAASMGLKFPGVDQVEEIDEVQTDFCDPFYADAVANEKDIDLSEEQRKNFKKVREEDDEKVTKKLQNHLKRRRYKKHRNKDTIMLDACASKENGYIGDKLSRSTNIASDMDEKQCLTDKDTYHQDGRPYTVILDSDEENDNAGISPPGFSKRKIGVESSPQSGKGHIIDVDAITTSKSNGVLLATKSNTNFHCTICLKVLPDFKVDRHPLLEVIICQDCKSGLKEQMDFKGTESGEQCCNWCGKYDGLVNCSTCPKMFCSACIGRNLGEEQLRQSKTGSWRCCICLPILLHKLILEYNKAFNSVDVSSGSECSDSDASVRRRKRKKKIRRILDDEELREETKQKIELEKARQEHLISMKPSGYSSNKVYDVLSGLDGESTEVLGDASTGYIVNFAREEGEDPVRIPPSISSWLKPHQVAGVRFMWQNIIQSVKKVKSGDKGLGCILAHTMGLGKTFQVISFLYTAMRVVDLGLKTAVVVTPVNVLHNWKQEFVKWKPSELKELRVFMLEDVPRDRRLHLLKKWSRKGGVLLIGYAAFRNLSFGKHVKDRAVALEMCRVLQRVPDILVCDEAHMIKNTKADSTQALKQVKTQRRIALTGSPLQNNLMEYFCMVDFVREGYLGSSQEFRNRFQNPIMNGQHANSTSNDVKIMNQRSHILYEQLKGFVQRVDLNVVKNDLPPKTVYVISVKLSPLQRKLYKRFLDVHGFTKEGVSSGNVTKSSCFFAGYQALARIWNHPGLLQMAKDRQDNIIREAIVENLSEDEISSDDNIEHSDFLYRDRQIKNESVHQNNGVIDFHETETVHTSSEINWWEEILDDKIYDADYSGKMVVLLDILSMSSEAGDKVLIFSQSLATLDLIELFLSKLPRKEGKLWKRGKDWYRLDGRTAASERQKLVEKFNDPSNRRVKCTLISTRAGSLGINLYAANRVVIVDGSWNPTNDLQAIYRAWRYGQIKPVFAYRLMAHGTMEEKIYKRQVTKEGLAARVVDRQQIYRTMSKEEILHLFEFGDDDVADAVADRNVGTCNDRSGQISSLLSQTALSFSDGGVSDKFMENILSQHYPRWIYDYHEHEMLLQENEDERLSKEEQDMALEAWEAEIREWEEVHRTMVDGSLPVGQMQQVLQSDSGQTVQVGQSPQVGLMPPVEQKLQVDQMLQDLQKPQGDQRAHHQGGAQVAPKPPRRVQPVPINKADLGKSSSRNTRPPRKCSNLSHLLTLRSQGTKAGCSTICGECLTQISWENLNRDGRPR